MAEVGVESMPVMEPGADADVGVTCVDEVLILVVAPDAVDEETEDTGWFVMMIPGHVSAPGSEPKMKLRSGSSDRADIVVGLTVVVANVIFRRT